MRELLSGELTYRTATLFLSTAIIVLSIYPATHFCVLPIALLIILINGFYVLCAWKFDMEWLLTAQWCSRGGRTGQNGRTRRTGPSADEPDEPDEPRTKRTDGGRTDGRTGGTDGRKLVRMEALLFSHKISYIQSRFAILMVEELEIVRRRKFLQKSNKRFQPVNLKAVMTAKTIKDIPNLIPFIEIDHNYSMHSLETFKR
uniref:Uncharacterized protein n=1 Tax=Caenorhabditis japonica TaxID=281687 RepID=A0A8R1IUC4_CAEJA